MPIPACVDRGEAADSGDTQVTINRLGQAAVGDLMIAVTRWHSGGVAAVTREVAAEEGGPGPVGAPAGWTVLATGTINDPGLTQGYSNYEIAYRVMQAGEAASYTFGPTGGTHAASWAQTSTVVYRNAGTAPRFTSGALSGTASYTEFPGVSASNLVHPHSLAVVIGMRSSTADVVPWAYGGAAGGAQEQMWNAGFKTRTAQRSFRTDWVSDVQHGPVEQPVPSRRMHFTQSDNYVSHTLILDPGGSALAASNLLALPGGSYMPYSTARSKLVSHIATIGPGSGGGANTSGFQWSFGPAMWEVGARNDAAGAHYSHTAVRGVTAGRQDASGALGPSDILVHATHSWHLEASTHKTLFVRAGWWINHIRTLSSNSETAAKCSSNSVVTHVGAGGYVLVPGVPAGADFFAFLWWTPQSGPAGFAGGYDFNDMATISAMEIL